jgi:hypothetical protein
MGCLSSNDVMTIDAAAMATMAGALALPAAAP